MGKAQPDPNEAAAFLDKAVDSFGGWVQYGDTKAGAVLVVLGLGLSNLVDNAHDLIDASGEALFATGLFAASLASAFLAVCFLAGVTFPFAPDPRRWRKQKETGEETSLLYVRKVATLGSGAGFANDVEPSGHS